MRKPIEPLNWPQSDILRALANGAWIVGERTYPHAHHYKMHSPVPKDGEAPAPSPVPANTISALIQHRLIDPQPRHPTPDVIAYGISSVGRAAVKRGNVYPALAEQTVFFADIR